MKNTPLLTSAFAAKIGLFDFIDHLEQLTDFYRNGEKEKCDALLLPRLAALTASLETKNVPRIAVYFTDKLYRIISSVLMYDAAFDDSLALLRKGFFDDVLARGFPIAYLVDNTFSEATKRIPMIGNCFRAAGFTVYSPEILFLEKKPLLPHDCMALSSADFLDSLQYKKEHCMFFTHSHESLSDVYETLRKALSENTTHIGIARQAPSSSDQIILYNRSFL